jgi:hypothetical protein
MDLALIIIPIVMIKLPFILFSTNQKMCSARTPLLDFSLLVDCCSSFKGLLR